MANLATQDITLAGLGPTYAAASAGGDTFTPDEGVIVHVKNGGASPITVTIVTPNATASGLAIADAGGSVPAGGERFFGDFKAVDFARASDGKADVTWSAVTSVTLAVLKP